MNSIDSLTDRLNTENDLSLRSHEPHPPTQAREHAHTSTRANTRVGVTVRGWRAKCAVGSYRGLVVPDAASPFVSQTRVVAAFTFAAAVGVIPHLWEMSGDNNYNEADIL